MAKYQHIKPTMVTKATTLITPVAKPENNKIKNSAEEINKAKSVYIQ